MPNMLQLFKHGWNLDDHRPEFKVRVSMLLIEGLADSRTEDASVSNITLTPDEGCDQRVCPLVRFAGSHKAGSTQHLGIFRVACQKVRQFECQCGIWLGAQNYQFGATLETARGCNGRGIIPKSFRLVCLSLPPIEIVGPSGFSPFPGGDRRSFRRERREKRAPPRGRGRGASQPGLYANKTGFPPP